MSDKTLTPDQLKSYQEILSFYNKPFGGFHLLQGFAGTGKTYLSIQIVNELADDIGNKILITAPTHKALQVLQKESKFNYPNVDFSTIHSALGLVESIDGFGRQTFKPSKSVPAKIKNFKFVIVDEASMLDDSLFFHLLGHVQRRSIRVLFIGDPAQIPPINKLDSLPFDSQKQKIYGITKSILHQIVRQSENNPIIQNSLNIRNNLTSKIINFSDSVKNAFGTVEFIDSNNLDPLISLLEDLFVSEKFQSDADYTKVIAWRNETVNMMNTIIREMIYGKEKINGQIPKILPGEKLVLDNAVMLKNKAILNTNDELVVEKYTIKTVDTPFFPIPFKIYDCVVKKRNLDGKMLTHNISILHETAEPTFGKKLTELKSAALSHKQGSFQAVQAWKKYYSFQNHFAITKYNYCITAHKCQGSTYDNAIVLDYDINANFKITERNRIKYTSCTRPRYNLFIVK